MPATLRDGTTAQQLSRSLRARHLVMITIGGIIGAGFFAGGGAAIALAGPGLLLSFVGVGALALLAMSMLSEMAAISPNTGSFVSYANYAFGRSTGFSIGWLYWWFWVVVSGVECTAAAVIAHRWTPAVPQWTWTLALMVVFTAANLCAVRVYGEIQFWFTLLKMVAIGVLVVVGLLTILGVNPLAAAPGLAHLTDDGGFLPNGSAGVFAGALLVVFSVFGGEIATIAAGETERPGRMIRKVVMGVMWWIILLYIACVTVVVTLVPWRTMNADNSPIRSLLQVLHAPAAATVVDIFVFVTVLSCLNSAIYAASRMGFALSRGGQAPRSLGRLSARSVPVRAVLVSTVVGFATVAINYVAPEDVFLVLVDSSGAIGVLVWLVIAATYVRLRHLGALSTPGGQGRSNQGFPYHAWLAIVGMVVVLAGMVFLPDTRAQLEATLVLALVIVVVALWRETSGD